ncbi:MULTISPECIES: hypothetical protein [unclassified Streptomyces]|uniref:hypothetical protein n=1 Tax=unclassified Streptomyces TaxID=2593676 RepID=UPI001369F738|nr:MULTISPECIES: hypothetical protein [unclassified Streptomyces]NEA03709.1 hypothetical protein [Streptomyces sp. SID10116]MYY79685.1 hypothetical protein [Streptomyces sp. SID335]MYZ12841.1 hypothetical protein [Streptomyces sp. SID337]NDZ91145.1 hypothetical protein [Streptomyces sp. SID10115]NEB43542.1 hypothetical protein [Streptomyces sp. SID339]
MSDRLSPQREAEIRERVEAATPGPWGAKEATDSFVDEILANPGEPTARFLARVSGVNVADGAFIAHARSDVPALLAEVERQRAELAAVRAECDEAQAELAAKRDEIADDIHRAELPVFAETENPVLVAKTVRAIDWRLAARGSAAPYWVARTEADR